jgi:lipopolysaccharide export system protein LptA
MNLIIQSLIIFSAALYFYMQSDVQSHLPTDKNIKREVKKIVGQVMKDFSLTEYKLNSSGQKDWRLNAKTAQSDPKDIVWSITDSEIFLFKNNLQVVKILSPKGLVNTKTKNFALQDQVVSETLSGYKFNSVGLNYNAQAENFFSEGEIYIEGPNRSTVLKGSSFAGDLKAGRVEIAGPIYCEQIVPEYEKPIIKSDRASIDIEKRHVKFMGQVLILIGEMTITAREAEFKYNKAKGDLDALIVRGQVFAAQKNQSASADLLEVRIKEGVFLFQGNPRFVSGENTLVGNEILLYNKGKSVQILKGRVKTESEIDLVEGK